MNAALRNKFGLNADAAERRANLSKALAIGHSAGFCFLGFAPKGGACASRYLGVPHLSSGTHRMERVSACACDSFRWSAAERDRLALIRL